MANPVVVEFQAHGVAQIEQAFGDITKAAEKAEKAQIASAEKTAKARKREAEKAAKAELDLTIWLAEQNAKARKAQEKADERHLLEVARRAREAAKEQEALAKKAAKEQEALAKKATQEAERNANAQLAISAQKTRRTMALEELADRLVQAQGKARVRAEAAQANEIVAIQTQKSRRIMRLNAVADALEEQESKAKIRRADQVAREEVRNAQKVADEKKRLADAADRHASSVRERWGRSLGYAAASGIGRGFNQVVGITSNAIQGVLSLGGGFSLSQAVTERMSAQKEAVLLSNSLYQEGRDAAHIDPTRILNKMRAASIESGVDVEEITKGARAYAALSSDKEGLGLGAKDNNNLATIAKIAKVNGASVEDVFTAMGKLRSQNKDLDADKLIPLMLNVAAQGRHGAVEIKDLAHVAGGIGKNAVYFGGDQTRRQEELLALSQIAIKTSQSPEEAAIAISNFSARIPKEAAAVRAGLNTDQKGTVLGVKRTGATDMASIIAETFYATGGNIDQMGSSVKSGGLGMTIRGNKIGMALKADYEKGIAKLLKDKPNASAEERNLAGTEAVRKTIADATMAEGSGNNLLKEHASIMSTPEERLNSAFRKMRDAVADKLVPALEQLIPVLEKMIPVFAEALGQAAPVVVQFLKSVTEFVAAHQGLINLIARHPFGAIFAKAISGSILQAGIGESVRTILVDILKKMSGGGGGGGAGGAGGGRGALAFGMAAVAVTAQSSLMDVLGRDTANAEDQVLNLAAKVEAGQVSPQDARKIIQGANKRRDDAWVLGDTGNLFGSMVGDASSERANAQRKLDEQITGRGGASSGPGSPADNLEKAIKAAEAHQKLATAAENASKALDKVHAPSIAQPTDPARNLPAVLRGGAL